MIYNLQRQFHPHIIAKLDDAHLSDNNVHQYTSCYVQHLKAAMRKIPPTHENKSMSHLRCWMACYEAAERCSNEICHCTKVVCIATHHR